jgi:hypothetical protein
MQLSLITNDPEFSRSAEDAGIDRILIDLERLGKAERQAGRGLFLSDHALADVPRVRRALRRAELMVRVDPLNVHSREQIDFVIDAGTDYVMLPYFHQQEEAQSFLEIVDGRVEPVLLVETAEAVTILAELCRLPRLAEIHVGLNDLSLSLGKGFLFDLIADGTVDELCGVLRDSAVPFGFAGIGSLSRRDLPVDPELILAEQVCQGATRGWLGRTFRETPPACLSREVRMLREAIESWRRCDARERRRLRSRLVEQVRAARGQTSAARPRWPSRQGTAGPGPQREAPASTVSQPR